MTARGATVARQWIGADPPDRAAGRLDDLAGWAGVVGAPAAVRTDGWLPRGARVWTVSTGDFLAARGLPHVEVRPSTGSGRTWADDRHARFVAICEGIERYSSLVYDLNDFTYATAEELGAAAMAFDRMARFSAAEVARSGGQLTLPSPAARIRWCAALDLHTGAAVQVPALMAFVVTEQLRDERFWLPISTGVALHRSVEQALVGAICEMVERDAAAICWLQKLPLPLLDPDALPAEVGELVRWFSGRGVRTLFFDATTDLGVPTVWCLQLADGSDDLGQVVGTACGMDHRTAALDAAMECVTAREVLHNQPLPPRRYSRYSGITDGATYMSRRARRGAFSFLVDGLAQRPVVPAVSVPARSPAEHLAFLLDVLAANDLPAYGVDLTTREARQAGLVVVRAVVPRLQPMSVLPRAQYRGTPRLYRAPARMGHPVRSESRLNRYPLPVA